MASCYICGRYIARNEGYRRRVETGDSFGISWGKNPTPSTRTYYGVRTLCHQCALSHDRAQRIKSIFLISILGGLVLLGSIGEGEKSGTNDSADYDTKVEPINRAGEFTEKTQASYNRFRAKIQNNNCFTYDFYIERTLVATIPAGMSQVVEFSSGASNTQICNSGTSNCGSVFSVPWIEGMTYTIDTDPACRNRHNQNLQDASPESIEQTGFLSHEQVRQTEGMSTAEQLWKRDIWHHQEYRIVRVNSDDVLNIRSDPGGTNIIIGTIPPASREVYNNGSGVLVGETLWIPVVYRNISGWVSSRYLEALPRDSSY